MMIIYIFMVVYAVFIHFGMWFMLMDVLKKAKSKHKEWMRWSIVVPLAPLVMLAVYFIGELCSYFNKEIMKEFKL